MFAALDVDNTGTVDAQEFFAGVLASSLLPQAASNVLEASFQLLDRCVYWRRLGALAHACAGHACV